MHAEAQIPLGYLLSTYYTSTIAKTTVTNQTDVINRGPLLTALLFSLNTHYEDMKDNEKHRNWGGLG